MSQHMVFSRFNFDIFIDEELFLWRTNKEDCGNKLSKVNELFNF